MIEIKHLSKTFQMKDGAVNALKNIDLTIPDGSIYGIIGMSGAGKSTLVRCINLLERPTEGSVVIDGKDLASLTPKEFDLLVFLVSNKGIALSREKILQKVWNYDYYGEDRTVDTHVKMLRGHLGACRKMIVTVWGIGYKFDPDAV